MANNNGRNGNGNSNGNSNGNGKERLDFSISSELNERLEAFAVAEDRSVQSVLRDSVERYLDKSDVREVIRGACEKGKLREGSSVCKNIDRD